VKTSNLTQFWFVFATHHLKLSQYFSDLSPITNCEILWPTFGFQTNVDTAYRQKRKQIDLKVKDLYWVIGRKSPTSLERTVLVYETIIKPVWTYGIKLLGMRQQIAYSQNATKPSKILQMITNVPWYVTDQTLHDDLKVPFIKEVIQEKSINHHNKLGNHSNTILQPLLEQQQRRRLKKFWPGDLIDG
jgi:hypothetical protein